MRKLLTLLALGLIAATAYSAEVWTVAGSNLATFNSATPGTLHVIGPTGVGWMDALDYSGSGTLYGYTYGTLYSLNTSTGEATLIGGGGLVNNDVGCDMAWNPVTQKMYLVGAIDVNSPVHLYSLNLNTGLATLEGTIDIPHPDLPFGLASDANGTLYLADGSRDGVYRLSGLSGTFLGPEGWDFSIFQGMTIDWSRDGTAYHGGYTTTNSHSELWTVNLTTGAGTFVGELGSAGLLFGDFAILPVPEPATAVVLSLIAFLRRR